MRRLALLLSLALALIAPARAEVAGLAQFGGGFEELRRGIEALGTSGDPRAATILDALQAGRLFTRDGGGPVIRAPDGSVTDAGTGAAVPDAAGLRAVRVNNQVRRTLDAAQGGLRLFATDPAVRGTAAETVFKTRDAAALPALDRALAAETVPAVRTAMREARAAALLASPDAPEAERLAAVAVLRARGDVDARGILGSLPAPQPGAVTAAAAAAVAAIDWSLKLWGFAQGAFYGVSLGSVLLLAAAGLAITFGVMGVINMAQGELVMIGAYTTFVVQGLLRDHAPGLVPLTLVFAVPAAFLVSGGLGVVVERGLIRFLYGRPLETLLATFGLSLVLQQAVRSIFGPTNREVSTPAWMSGSDQVGQMTVTWNRVAIIVFAVAVLLALMAVLRFTALGLRMRAVTQNRRMAAAMGIRTPWIDALTFGLGSGVAGMAGVALSQIDNVSPNLGQGYIIDSFMVVVFGGVGNLWGTAVGALTLGVVNKFLEPVAGAVLGKIVVLILLILFIQRRPRGLFPLKGRAVEA